MSQKINPSNFVGPLPEALTRDEVGTVRMRYRYRTARDFVLAAGVFMRTMGREVTVKETEDSVSVSSLGQHWTDSSILVMAFRGSRRWRFHEAANISKGERVKTYQDARIMMHVYGD